VPIAGDNAECAVLGELAAGIDCPEFARRVSGDEHFVDRTNRRACPDPGAIAGVMQRTEGVNHAEWPFVSLLISTLMHSSF
jgi:hypothetical protein